MLAGHYAAAYALRRARPAVSLWLLFVAVQAVDVVFFVFAVSGIERLEVAAGERGPLAMHLINIPYTHSLLMTTAYAAAIVVVGLVMKRVRAAVVLAAALVSHWTFDVFVHTRDLPLTVAAGATHIGLGLWRHPIAALLLEIGLVLVTYFGLRRSIPAGRARLWGDVSAAVLVVAQVIYVFGPAPTTVLQMACAAEAIYLVMALIAWQVDRHTR